MNQTRRSARQRGVSLIEALVALAVMAIGMLAIVGVQATLRTNSDVAKQRTEALRLAQREVEKWRSFVVLGPGATGTIGYEDITSDTFTENGVNATFSVTRTVADLPASSPGKSLKVSVDWNDRTNDNAQRVQLSTVVAGIAPELAPTLSIMGDGDTARRPGGRNRGIPITAKDLGDGTSGLIPPRSSGGVVWVFNNNTGLIRLCSTTVTVTSDLDTTNITCADNAGVALLLAGFVHYSVPPSIFTTPSGTTFTGLIGSALTEALSLQVGVDQTLPSSLAGLVDCFSDVFDSETLAYYCAVPVLQIPNTTPAWSGSVRFAYPVASSPQIASSPTSTSSSQRKVCRYPAASAAYSNEQNSRLNQNFLLIRAGRLTVAGSATYPCPSTPVAFVLHQP
jgi:prepilin-type N-terminal cleavage/methylation domain-containing protein